VSGNETSFDKNLFGKNIRKKHQNPVPGENLLEKQKQLKLSLYTPGKRDTAPLPREDDFLQAP
jgi:hypothetical protein